MDEASGKNPGQWKNTDPEKGGMERSGKIFDVQKSLSVVYEMVKRNNIVNFRI